MNSAEIIIMQAENAALKEKVSGICRVYAVLRPVLNVLKLFSFLKKGGKLAINTAISVLDEVCEVR